MRHFIMLLAIIFLLGCQKKPRQNPFIGTWNRCLPDGTYCEFKITNNYTIYLNSSGWEGLSLISNQFKGDTLIGEGINVSLPNEIDTLVLTYKSNDTLILKSSWKNQTIILHKIKNEIADIDSLNLNNWIKETFSNFDKRAKHRNCPDFRTEEEKIIHDLGDVNVEKEEETEIPAEFLPDSIK